MNQSWQLQQGTSTGIDITTTTSTSTSTAGTSTAGLNMPYRPKNPEPLPAKVLEPILQQLNAYPDLEVAPKSLIEEVIRILDNRACVLGSGENSYGASLYTVFCEKWEPFLENHPDIKNRVDPHYVMAGTNPLPANFAAVVAAYNPGVRFEGVPLIPINDEVWCWTFPPNQAGRDRALHFIGYMNNAIPGLSMWQITTTSRFVVY